MQPIREGIEKLPEAMQPIGEATGEATEEEEEEEIVGEIAYKFLNKPFSDRIFGIRKIKGHHYIGSKHVIIKNNDIIIAEDGERFEGTPGLWELITSKNPKEKNYTGKDEDNYEDLMIMTNALHHNYDEDSSRPRANRSAKWVDLLGPFWRRKRGGVFMFPKKKEGYEGEGVVVIPSDPNALLERLDLLLASQEAGHTGVRNELVSICDELKRQGVLDTKAYKKLNSNIKK